MLLGKKVSCNNMITMMDVEKETVTLLQLQKIIKSGVEGAAPGAVWVKAEIAEIKENYSGHCYLELVEYNDKQQLMAKVRAVIWASQYRVIKPYFKEKTGSYIEAGMHLLMQVIVQFSEVYGLSLVIRDIDPDYSIGELERKRLETIERLKREGLIDRNKELALPPLPRKFAVISATTAAGYRDFIKHLHNNEFGFKFATWFFPAPMQGTDAPKGVADAINKATEYNKLFVAQNEPEFDAVIIIRGGGSVMDLSAFDDYCMAEAIANCPFPVITGIGHDHDYHVADMVANTDLKTPTAVADFILDIFAGEAANIESLSARIRLAVINKLNVADTKLQLVKNRLRDAVLRRLQNEEYRLSLLEQKLRMADPTARLRPGEVIIEIDGKRYTNDIETFREGANVVLHLKEGVVSFNINNVEINCREEKK